MFMSSIKNKPFSLIFCNCAGINSHAFYKGQNPEYVPNFGCYLYAKVAKCRNFFI
jgi:hypothetical protein